MRKLSSAEHDDDQRRGLADSEVTNDAERKQELPAAAAAAAAAVNVTPMMTNDALNSRTSQHLSACLKNRTL